MNETARRFWKIIYQAQRIEGSAFGVRLLFETFMKYREIEIGSAIIVVTLNKQTHSFLTSNFMTKPIIKSSSRAGEKRFMTHVGTQLKFEALQHNSD